LLPFHDYNSTSAISALSTATASPTIHAFLAAGSISTSALTAKSELLISNSAAPRKVAPTAAPVVGR
jgi:hypothetical protein